MTEPPTSVKATLHAQQIGQTVEVRLLSGVLAHTLEVSPLDTARDVLTALIAAKVPNARSSRLVSGSHELGNDEAICPDATAESTSGSPLVLQLVKIGVRSDGFYVSYADVIYGQYSGSTYEQCALVLRFYTDEMTVLEAACNFADGEETCLLKWFHRDQKNSRGTYQVGSHDDIEFETGSSGNTVQYRGVIEAECLRLSVHALATGTSSEEIYTFRHVEMLNL